MQRLALLCCTSVLLGLLVALPGQRTPNVEAELARRVSQLGLDESSRGEPLDRAALFAELTEFDRRLFSDGVGPPGIGEPRSRIVDRMEWLGEHVAQLETLLESPGCRRALEAPGNVDWAADPGARTPGVDGARRWVNLLCCQALVEAQRGEAQRAVDLVARAHDLAYLLDDGTSSGYVVRYKAEWIVVSATRMLAVDGVSASDLRKALDPRLVRALDPERLRGGARGECRRWLAQQDLLGTGPLPAASEDADRGIRIERALALLDSYERLVDGRPLCDGFPCSRTGMPELHELVRHAHGTGIHLNLARVALALAEHQELTGSWPAELAELEGSFAANELPASCQRRTLRYERSDDSIVVSLPMEGDPSEAALGRLTLWRWAR